MENGEMSKPATGAKNPEKASKTVERGSLVRAISGAGQNEQVDPTATDKISLRQRELKAHESISQELNTMLPPDSETKKPQ